LQQHQLQQQQQQQCDVCADISVESPLVRCPTKSQYLFFTQTVREHIFVATYLKKSSHWLAMFLYLLVIILLQKRVIFFLEVFWFNINYVTA